MGERSDQIEREIQATRSSLSENLGELEDRVKSAVDWRTQVEERPGTMLALAFGGGILLSALLPTGRAHDRSRPSEANRHSEPTSSRPPAALDWQSTEALDPFNAMKGALVGVAISKASAFIDHLLPGFEHEFANSRATQTPARSGADIPAAYVRSNAAGAD